MPTFSRTVKVSIDDNIKYTVLIEGDDSTGKIKILIYDDPYANNQILEASWDIDDQYKSISFDVAGFNTSLNTQCLIGCMIGVSAPFAVCIKKAKNKKDVWKCIQEHSAVAGISAVACVVGCI